MRKTPPPDLLQWAASRETSVEVAGAICFLYPDTREQVWESPTEEQRAAVVALAWSAALADETTLHWGEVVLRRPAAPPPQTP